MSKGPYSRKPGRARRVKLNATDQAIIERRMGPLREREYRRADTDDFIVARERIRAGGIVRSITGMRRPLKVQHADLKQDADGSVTFADGQKVSISPVTGGLGTKPAGMVPTK